MDIYKKIVIDISTLQVISCDKCEYHGDVAMCGGKGGGKQTTHVSNEPDKEYNRRMATVAEKQVGLSDEYFNWWKQVQAPVEQAMAEGQLGLIPAQTDIARDFYKAVRPTSAEAGANTAAADMGMAINTQQGTMNRNLQRMGIDPTSSASADANRQLALASAAQMAGAANTGRTQAEDENLRKLAGAM